MGFRTSYEWDAIYNGLSDNLLCAKAGIPGRRITRLRFSNGRSILAVIVLAAQKAPHKTASANSTK